MFVYPGVLPPETLNTWPHGIVQYLTEDLFANTSLIIDSSRTLETRVSVSSLRAPLFEVIEVPYRMSANHLIGAAVNQIVQGDDDHNADIIWNKEVIAVELVVVTVHMMQPNREERVERS